MEGSRRQRMLEYAETGRLRNALNRGGADDDVADLIVDICIRYGSPRRPSRLAVFIAAQKAKGKE